jgi:hypothetical protein
MVRSAHSSPTVKWVTFVLGTPVAEVPQMHIGQVFPQCVAVKFATMMGTNFLAHGVKRIDLSL